jgi:hypothetical protein
MNALTQRQSLSLILKDLAVNYQMQFGADEFDKRVIETGLRYYPNGIHLYLVKFEHYREKLLVARRQKQPKSEEAYKKELSVIEQQLNELGYKEPSQKKY